MHLVMSWFVPFAGLLAWMGVHTVLDLPHESRRNRTQTLQLLGISLIPLLVWLIAQFTSRPGALP